MNAPIDMAKFAAQVCGMTTRTPAYMLGSDVYVLFKGLDLMVELDYETQIEAISTSYGDEIRDVFTDVALAEIRVLALKKLNEKEPV